MDTATQIVHRLFYIGVGKASPNTSKRIIEEVKESINESTKAKNVPENTFLDIYIPLPGETNSRVEIVETHLAPTAFGRFPDLK